MGLQRDSREALNAFQIRRFAHRRVEPTLRDLDGMTAGRETFEAALCEALMIGLGTLLQRQLRIWLGLVAPSREALGRPVPDLIARLRGLAAEGRVSLDDLRDIEALCRLADLARQGQRGLALSGTDIRAACRRLELFWNGLATCPAPRDAPRWSRRVAPADSAYADVP